MNHGTLEETVLLKIFNQICQKFNLPDPATSENLDKAIDLINTKILNYDQKITKLQYGLNLINFYIFYSTATTSISKMQNIFNETELEFFKLILHKIIDSEDLSISPIVALNSQINLGGKVNQSRAGKLLQNWISAGYFLKHEDNLIYLGPKSLMEFKEILQNMELPYLRTCLLCEDVAPWVKKDEILLNK